jgi:hypothetical protein
MTIEFQDGVPEDRETFEAALTSLFAAASENGVDVVGGWECRHDNGGHDWEAVVVELADERIPAGD